MSYNNICQLINMELVQVATKSQLVHNTYILIIDGFYYTIFLEFFGGGYKNYSIKGLSRINLSFKIVYEENKVETVLMHSL